MFGVSGPLSSGLEVQCLGINDLLNSLNVNPGFGSRFVRSNRMDVCPPSLIVGIGDLIRSGLNFADLPKDQNSV